MDKLTLLLNRCKCGVHLTVNDHRDVYQTAKQAIEDLESMGHTVDDADVRAKMVDLDTIVDLHFYPDTPVGFYKVLHYDLDMALDIALAELGIAP
jgi:hypothetical protein